MNLNNKRIFDPLYGVIQLTDFEFSIISSPEIQRLRYVRMCNINSLLVTGASEISRFEHTIGVLNLAKEWIKVNGSKLSYIEKNEVCAAALMHDFQTGPFGHSLQYVLEDNENDADFVHDDLEHGQAEKFHQITDENSSFTGRLFQCQHILSDSWDNVATLIRGEGVLGPLISGSMDLDNIDNVIRLAYHVGVAKTSDSEIAIKLARDIKPTRNGLLISEATILLVERWQEIRKKLYELLLLDWAEFSAKAMLTRAMELALDFNLLGTDSWLKTDLELFSYLETASIGEAQEVGSIVKRIKCGELFFPLFLGRSLDISQYETFSSTESKRMLETELTLLLKNELGLKTNLIIHPILDYKKTSRSLNATIFESDETINIGNDSKQLLIGVFTSKEITSEDKAKNSKNIVANFLEKINGAKFTILEDPMHSQTNSQIDLL